MENKHSYHERIKSFLPQHVANFKAKGNDEAHKIGVGQKRRGHEYRKKENSRTDAQKSADAIDRGLK